MHISRIHAYEIIASGGYPSLEVIVELSDGSRGIASVPYGASAGSHEATVLVDHDPKRYDGQGMLTAIDHVSQVLAPVLCKQSFESQSDLDATMIKIDGTENKRKLGGNTILAVSLAYAKAVAASRKQALHTYILAEFQLPSVHQLPHRLRNFLSVFLCHFFYKFVIFLAHSYAKRPLHFHSLHSACFLQRL